MILKVKLKAQLNKSLQTIYQHAELFLLYTEKCSSDQKLSLETSLNQDDSDLSTSNNRLFQKLNDNNTGSWHSQRETGQDEGTGQDRTGWGDRTGQGDRAGVMDSKQSNRTHAANFMFHKLLFKNSLTVSD